MKIKGVEMNPEGEWKWTTTGFLIGTVIGAAATSSIVSGMIYGLIAAVIAWTLCFYDHNFSGLIGNKMKEKI